MPEHTPRRAAPHKTPGPALRRSLLLLPLLMLACSETPSTPTRSNIDFVALRYTATNGRLVDLNGDGKLDLVSDNNLYPGLGDGTFGAAIALAPDPNPPANPLAGLKNPLSAFLSGDITGDGIPDSIFAVGDERTGVGTLQVYRGVKGRNEPLASSMPFSVNAVPWAVNDLDGDGQPELLISDGTGRTLLVLHGHADGSLTPGLSIHSDQPISQALLADVNGDHRPDILALRNQNVSLYLQNIDGSFQNPADFPADQPSALYSGDLDNDGLADVLVRSSNSPSLAILFGERRGALLAGRWVTAQIPKQGHLDLIDLDVDGKLDLIITDNGVANILRGNGDGTFIDAHPLGLPPWLSLTIPLTGSLDFVDLNGDKHPDAVFGNPGFGSFVFSSGLAVALNQSGGRLDFAPYFVGADDVPSASGLADLNGDGKPDFVASSPQQLNTFLGRGSSDYQMSTHQRQNAGPTALSLGDLNGDGQADLLSLLPSGSLTLQYGNGDGSFTGAATINAGRSPTAFTTADLDGDGLVDLVVSERSSASTSVLLANRNGGFLAPSAISDTSGVGDGLASGDLNGDGLADVVLSLRSESKVHILLGDGKGGLHRQTTLTIPDAPRRAEPPRAPLDTRATPIRLADLNHDGKLDLVLGFATSSPLVALGAGDGSFGPAQSAPVEGDTALCALQLADLDGDGHLDLIALTDTVQVLRGSGDGHFGAPRLFTDGNLQPRDVHVGDMDGDGKPDLFLVNDFATSVLRNRSR